jgi:hypothetical protein
MRTTRETILPKLILRTITISPKVSRCRIRKHAVRTALDEANTDICRDFAGVKEDDPEDALSKFRAIVAAEAGEPSKWQVIRLYRSRSTTLMLVHLCRPLRRGFKALKQSTKILFLELHRPEDALKTYEELLPYTKVSLILSLYYAVLSMLICRVDIPSSIECGDEECLGKIYQQYLRLCCGRRKSPSTYQVV